VPVLSIYGVTSVRWFTFFAAAAAAAVLGCDSTGPTLDVRVAASPATIVTGGSDTVTVRVIIANLTAVPVERVVSCDNLFSVDDVLGTEVVSSYRVTCPAENSIPLIIELGPFESVELERIWTGVNIRYEVGSGYVAVPLPPGAYRIYGRLGELRSRPRPIALVAP
jgi:hypothetical protein